MITLSFLSILVEKGDFFLLDLAGSQEGKHTIVLRVRCLIPFDWRDQLSQVLVGNSNQNPLSC